MNRQEAIDKAKSMREAILAIRKIFKNSLSSYGVFWTIQPKDKKVIVFIEFDYEEEL